MPEGKIHAEGLSKTFGQFIAVDGVDLNVAAGEVLALLGPNGAGKTTTVRMLTSVLRPSRGRAWICGYDVLEQPEQVRASVGVLTEHHGLYNRMTAGEYLEFYGGLYQLTQFQIRKQAARLMEIFGLDGSEKKRLGEYSKGMRQKLALVRAMLHDPPVLLLDEPTSAMDPESARTVRESILNLRSADRAIVICTHNLAEAEQLADQIAIIRQGRIILSGSIEQLVRDLLGPEQYEVRLAGPAPVEIQSIPEGAELISTGENWLRFSIAQPEKTNPALLHLLLDSGAQVVSYQPIPRHLEQVYMTAVQRGVDAR